MLVRIAHWCCPSSRGLAWLLRRSSASPLTIAAPTLRNLHRVADVAHSRGFYVFRGGRRQSPVGEPATSAAKRPADACEPWWSTSYLRRDGVSSGLFLAW